MKINLDDRVRDFMRRAGLYKQAYWRRLMRKSKTDIADLSLKTAIVSEIPFVASKIDRLPEDAQVSFFCHFDKEDLGCDVWDAVAEAELEPGVDGGYDVFVTEDRRDIHAIMQDIKDILSEDGKWK